MSLTNDNLEVCEEFSKIAEKNFQQLEQKMSKIGYSDGVSDGYGNEFQKSFDLGYNDGFNASLDINKFHCFFVELSKNIEIVDKDLQTECTHYLNSNMRVLNVLKEFKFPVEQLDNMESILKDQQKRNYDLIEKFVSEMPKTANLLNVVSNEITLND